MSMTYDEVKEQIRILELIDAGKWTATDFAPLRHCIFYRQILISLKHDAAPYFEIRLSTRGKGALGSGQALLAR